VARPAVLLRFAPSTRRKSSSYAAEAEKSLLSYCLRHDYTAYIYRAGLYSGIHPTWHKARALLNNLGDHRGVVWVDADTLFLKQDRKVFEPFLSSPKSLHICKDLATQHFFCKFG
jgi:hypothetical protein